MSESNVRRVFDIFKFRFVGLVSVVLVSACATPEQNAEKDAITCANSGYVKGTKDFLDCMNRTSGDREERQFQMQQSIALGLKSYGESSQQSYNNYQRSRPRQTSCYSSGYGYGTTTNCTTY